MKLPAWTREPLVQFLLCGALLFAFFAWRGEEVDPTSRSIDITREDQARLSLRFEALMRRPPTDAELDSLIEQYLREEILYREALRLGLDQDDPVLRRRLSQKMDELAGARAETAPVSSELLAKWLARHPARFARDTALSFDQLWFADEGAANDALAQLANGADWSELGEEISLPSAQDQADVTVISSRFGAAFSEQVAALDADGEWNGPVASGFGWHLVRLRHKQVGEVPPLAEIRSDVENDWRSRTIADRKQQAFELLSDAYSIDIEK